ncbi:MAG: class B sortase [Clostridium sp.]|uniref:class B sortase n=1 Tax=Clostridium sp. TaxID=1506 RepID=UPI002A754FD0|nr:class B sortase [Clostridium sp.]MCI6691594.1 class B sortase [Clostridium sp.]MDY2632468.1 class B sortase [Clostridium sp.]MDY4253456.1 class B sortase [Clostridium sp.]
MMMKYLRKILILIFLSIFIFSVYNLYKIFYEYKQNKDVYNDIGEIVVKEDKEIQIKNEEYLALKEINEDYLFWISIPETNVNYPVVKSKNNEDYLYKNFKGEDNKGGCLFVDSRNVSEEDDNIIIHGHNMKDKSMFGTLSKLLTSEYLNKNNKIYLYLENKILEYEIFSVYVNDSSFDPYKTNFNTDEEFNEYINTVRKKSYYNLDYVDDGNRNIITLSTCTNATGDERTIVNAKLVSTKDI